jgi:hypothetical protein
MYQINYQLCKYLCLLNVILTLSFILLGNPEVSVLFGSSAIVALVGMKFFEKAIKVQQERKSLMDTLGDNDYAD